MWNVFTQKEAYTAIYSEGQDSHPTSNDVHRENVRSAWGCLELMWFRLWGFILSYVQYINEVKRENWVENREGNSPVINDV